MKTKFLLYCVSVFLVVIASNFCIAGEPGKNQTVKAPSIEGTYKLVARTFPDGKTQSAPGVIGLLTFTKSSRNFNVAWKDSTGKHFSLSIVSTYKLTASEYTETILLNIMNDEIGGKGITYTTMGKPQTVPVKMDEGRIEFKMPFDPVSAVFDGSKFTATNGGAFVDTWEKVK